MTKLSLETARTMYESGIESIKAFALENYPELENKPLPSTWEELGEVKGYYITAFSSIAVRYGLAVDSEMNILPTESLAKAMLAMCKLQYLKHIYNDGWKPDFSGSNENYAIYFKVNKPIVVATGRYSKSLTFKTKELAELFLKNFIVDIMIAKELI